MSTKPTVDDVLPKLHAAAGVPFGRLFPGHLDLLRNKGHVGQLLCLLVGLPLDGARCDFSDGELKTNKSDTAGKPLETMWIMQIASIVDSLLCDPPLAFERTELYLKIQHLVYLPVVKEPRTDHAKWYFRTPVRVRARFGSPLFLAYQTDYEQICALLRRDVTVATNATMHTASGKYLQVRTKDSRPYHPIRSSKLGRVVSDKNRGFYFMKRFMVEAQAGLLPAGS